MRVKPQELDGGEPEQDWNDEESEEAQPVSALRGFVLALILSLPFWALAAIVALVSH